MDNANKEDVYSRDHRQLNPLATGIAGAVLGIGITAVAAKILSDKKMKDKIMNTASDLGSKALKLLRNQAATAVEKFNHEISRLRKPAGKHLAA